MEKTTKVFNDKKIICGHAPLSRRKVRGRETIEWKGCDSNVLISAKGFSAVVSQSTVVKSRR
ncbi:hypothetical protein A7X67_05970 [Clostridium sp. W14A]|nr:hypothetical protein A7X67_05970 [Clostridium sp. W14A]